MRVDISKLLNEVDVVGMLKEVDDSIALATGDVTPDKVIEKLNVIRAGKSFKSDEVNKALTSFVEDLSKPEKTSLLSFLKALAQIATGEVPLDGPKEPNDEPANIEMSKENDGKKTTEENKDSDSKQTDKVVDSKAVVVLPPKKEKKTSKGLPEEGTEDSTPPKPVIEPV